VSNVPTIQDDLLAKATVRIDSGGRPVGSGFFVSPGTVVTCDHVVQATRLSSKVAAPQLTVTDSSGAQHAVESVSVLSSVEEDDLATLRVPVAGHACVLLDVGFRAGDELHTFGYPKGHPEGVPTGLTSEGETGGANPRVKVSEGQVQPGMSGSPVLNLRTGGVFGVLKKTRGERTDLGGYAIPVAALFRLAPQLRNDNEQFHDKDRRWFDLLPPDQQRLVRAAWGPAKVDDGDATLFVVTVEQAEDVWQVRAAVHPPGETVGPVAVDFNRVRQKVARLFRDWASRGRVDEADQIRLLGDILYKALFPTEVDEKLEALLAQQEGRRIHVALHFEEEANLDLVHLPWEHLWVDKRGARAEVYLASDARLGLSRVLEAEPEENGGLPSAGRLSVLLLGVKPKSYDDAPQDVRETAAAVDRAVEDIVAVTGKVENVALTHLDTPVVEALPEAAGQPFDVLHYVGPGQFRSGVDELALGANTAEGIDYFGIDVLAGAIEDASPKLVVLQLAGRSATVLADFAILAHKLLSEQIPAVVGFQYPVPPERARKFSECLYPALASGASVDAAVQQARKAMRLGQPSRAFISPALFLLRPASVRLSAPAGPGEAAGSQTASALAHV
jgi:hypothetical protein